MSEERRHSERSLLRMITLAGNHMVPDEDPKGATRHFEAPGEARILEPEQKCTRDFHRRRNDCVNDRVNNRVSIVRVG